MAISVQMTIPTSSSWYSTGGDTTITLSGVNNFIMNTKKSLIKIPIPQSKATQDASPSDEGKNYVKDLKKIEDTMKIRGWLVDTTDSSAWEQAWQLRAMSARGGPVTSLIVVIAHPSRTLGLDIADTSSASMNTARVEVDLAFYLGDER